MTNQTPDKRIGFYRSVYFKLPAFIAILFASAGLLQLYATTLGFADLAQEVLQELHWDSAAELANRLQPSLLPDFDKVTAEQRLYELTLLNPELDAYLLDSTGRILARDGGEHPVVRTQIDLAPLLRALDVESPGLVLRGENPLHPNRKVPFAVTQIQIGQQPGYLYVILNSADLLTLARLTGQFFIVKTMALGGILILLSSTIVGFLLFRLLTSRLRNLMRVLGKFANGDFSERAVSSSTDELGALAATVNQMADAIAASNAAIEDRDSRRRELVAGIAHDLRNPVLAMRWHLERAAQLNDTHQTEQVGSALRLLSESLAQQYTLTEDLFELSKLEARERVREPDLIALKGFVETQLAHHRPAAEQAQVSLSYDAGQFELPDVLADPLLLTRAIGNLVQNAIRYAGKDGWVKIRARPAGDRVEIAVLDSGPGIPQEQQELVMQAFYQSDPSSRGAGLGLAIVKRIAEMHGSNLDLQSTDGAATTFSFSLQAEA